MAQGILPFKYAREFEDSGTTALAGLPAYLELAHVTGLLTSIDRNIQVRQGRLGYDDRQMIMALVLMNLAGGDCVEDLARLEEDAGLARVLRQVELVGKPRRERRAMQARWRKERSRVVPSASAVFRYLDHFRSDDESQRTQGKAFIPAPSEGLSGLRAVNRDLIAAVDARHPCTTATLDMDATLIEVTKKEAMWCYKQFAAYSALNVFWHEQELMVHTEFRDGNVPPGYEQTRVLKQAIEWLPPGVQNVFVRCDAAGHEQELLRYLAEGKDPRFGVIGFAVGAKVTTALKADIANMPPSDWHPLYRERKDGRLEPTGREWAEIPHVPGWTAHKKNGPDYRFLATRERLTHQPLPGMEAQMKFDFATSTFAGSRDLYEVHAVITNRKLPGAELLKWYYGRCGKSEGIHDVMKRDLAGGRLPSKYFGVNAAWWAIMVLALNLHAAMRLLVLTKVDSDLATKRFKALRFLFIALPGRVVDHARQLWIRVGGSNAWSLLQAVRKRLASFGAT